MSKSEVFHAMLAVGVPIGVLALGLFTISNLANFI